MTLLPPPKLQSPAPVPMDGKLPAWWTTLQRCGMPTSVVLIDFESYHDKDYHMNTAADSGLSVIQYVVDERWEETGKAIVEVTQPFGSPEPTFWQGCDDSIVRHLQREYGENLDGCTVVAQNLLFDGTVLSKRYGITPAHCVDILGLARYLHPGERNDLHALTKRYHLLRKGDSSQFKGLHLSPKWFREPGKVPKMMWRGMTPEEFQALSDYGSHDARVEWELFIRMLPRFATLPTELRLIEHTLNLYWKPMLRVDEKLGEEIEAKMLGKVDEVLKAANHTREEISGNKSFSAILGAALDACGDTIDRFQKENKRGQKILAIAKTDAELDDLKTHADEKVRKLIDARTAIKSWPNHAGRVRRILDMAKAAEGLLPVPLKYYGAHTGRWSGGERINLQNLGSRGDPLITSVRGILVAPPGYKLVIVDAAQIEARVLDWISEQDDPVWSDPRRDPYCEFASKMAGKVVVNTKKVKQQIAVLKSWHDRMRGMGKVGQLGCGYGMGSEKAMTYAENSYGVEMTPLEAERLVKVYREDHPKVCKFWRVVEQRFKAAARYAEASVMPRGLKFHKEVGDYTVITLPNGRQLRYLGVKVSIIDGQEKLWMPDPMVPGKRTFMWGGFLTENVVQAISRDILAEAMLGQEDAGYRVALHCHDESVGCVKSEVADRALADSLVLFSTPPVWAQGCPLAAEGKVVDRYEK